MKNRINRIKTAITGHELTKRVKKKLSTPKSKIILVLALILIIRLLGVNRLNVNSRYRAKAKDYLEEKYGESFYVKEGWRDTRDQLIPHFGFPETCYYIAYPLSDENYAFRVYITRWNFGYSVMKIEDDYYWRFLRRELQQYTQDHLREQLGEFKVDISTDSSTIHRRGFHSNLMPDSTLGDFLKTPGPMFLSIEIILPESVETIDLERVEVIIYDFVSKLIIESGNKFSDSSWVSVYCAKSREQYDLIDTSIVESAVRDKGRPPDAHPFYSYYDEYFWFKKGRNLECIYGIQFRKIKRLLRSE